MRQSLPAPGAVAGRLGAAGATLALVLAAAPAVWAEPWAFRSVAGEGGALRQAYVGNASGQDLEISRDPAGTVRGALRLGPGLKSLAPDACPTFQVDEAPAVSLARTASPCVAGAGEALFVLGEIRDDRLRSGLVTQLMNGREVVLRYRLADGAGYGAARFPLTRSKQALAEALGGGVRVTHR